MRRPYFKTTEGAPPALRHRVERMVRFEEVDPLGIVWHGRYPSYFEDARVALGERFGIGYLDFHRQGVVAPIRKLHVDYHRPLRFRESFTIEGILHWSEAARLNHEFIIHNSDGEIATTGYSVQMLMDSEERLLLVVPQFFAEFCVRWQRGEFA